MHIFVHFFKKQFKLTTIQLIPHFLYINFIGRCNYNLPRIDVKYKCLIKNKLL
jgi:hypothetical protein